MSIWRLVAREALYRRLSFGLAVFSVVVAVGCLVGQLALLHAHDARTQEIVAQKEAETKARMAALEDEIRKITVRMGFNILILPKDQKLADLWAKDYADKYMPEEYAERLANSGVVTVNHLLPSLQQRLEWPEQKRTVILVGTRGELPIANKAEKKPILDLVPAGSIVLGYELHQGLGLARGRPVKPGDRVTLLGRKFKVSKLYAKRGSKDDITLWINLREAQELLGRRGQINGILALGCNCSAERLGIIREEIARILPDTQVEEFQTRATARAEARNAAAREAEAALARENQNRERMYQEQEAFAAVVVPLVLLGCVVWLGVLALGNVREREPEIGVLRALGVRSGQLFALFLSRAALVGLVGALAGCAAGLAVARVWADTPAGLSPWLLLGVVVATPALCAAASWVPALLAARQDPAVILRQE